MVKNEVQKAQKKEIANKYLAFILVIAIVVSVVGTWYGIDKITKFSWITGYGSNATGQVNVTISSEVSINVVATACNFGSGYPNATPSTVLESNGTNINWSGAGTGNNITIENDGSTYVNVTVNSTKNCTGFWGISSCADNTTEFKYWTANVSGDGGCGGATAVLQSFAGWNSSNISNMTRGNVCSNMTFQDSYDRVNFMCRLVLAQSVPSGSKSDTLTFWAIQV